MAFWKLQVLGDATALGGQGQAVPLPAMAWPMIGIVAAMPQRRIKRTTLAETLWPDSDSEAARRCLATSLWRIRQRFGSTGDDLLAATGDIVALTPGQRVWIDVVAFEHKLQAALRNPANLDRAPARRRLRRALALYRGDFLAREANEWIAIERERLRALFLDSALELARANVRHGEWRPALELGRTICAVEPLREDAQRLLLEAMVACGNRAQAVQHYKDFEKLLEAELGVRPMRETRRLVEQLSGQVPAQATTARPVLVAPDREILLLARRQIQATLHLIDTALA